jgi:hypothetical protein
MKKLAASLIFFSVVCGPHALAQQADAGTNSNFPANGYLPLPPHFQPRRGDAASKITVPPPPLPTYQQPAIPEDGDLWMPGFWAWRDEVSDYYWVPGTWVKPPRPDLLWTPPYWSRVESGYAYHVGYWAETVGFYGGIDYGHGYTGDGYQGGRWDNGVFHYNRAVNNLGSVDVANTYDQAIEVRGEAVRVSFNGGRHGAAAKPTSEQEALSKVRHIGPTLEQRRHFELAAIDRPLYSKLNRGLPSLAATTRAGVFAGEDNTHSSSLPTMPIVQK